ncbi:MAG: hypothetical protein V2A59_04400 [Candidatus Omnitrophota bacterium]
MKRFIFYLFRWQLSTPILWLVVRHLGVGLGSTIIANLVGGVIFFWVDRFIFTSPRLEVWHLKEKGICQKCKREARLRRLVRSGSYDRTESTPVFLCSNCSREKLAELKSRGVKISHAGHNGSL